MKSEQDKFNELLKYVIEAPDTRSDREIILMLGLYGEYVVNSLLQDKSKKDLHKINSQGTKLKILFDLGQIKENEYDVLNKLKQVRNHYAHKLELSENEIAKIEDWMKGINMSWYEADKAEEQEKTAREYPFLKFKVACIGLINVLMYRIAKIKEQIFDTANIVWMVHGKYVIKLMIKE